MKGIGDIELCGAQIRHIEHRPIPVHLQVSICVVRDLARLEVPLLDDTCRDDGLAVRMAIGAVEVARVRAPARSGGRQIRAATTAEGVFGREFRFGHQLEDEELGGTAVFVQLAVHFQCLLAL